MIPALAEGVGEFADAKLNLALHVTGRRDDGYHLLDSLVCFADAGDRIDLAPGPLSLTIDGPFADGLASDDNLCLRAARSVGAEVAIRLTKNLPVASGIGGGSADAAAVLRGLHRMGYPLPANPEILGADVPVCIASAPARMQGVGEILTPAPPLPPLHMVLANPGVALSTPQVFSRLETRDNPPLPPIPLMPDMAALIAWCRATRNDLQAPAIKAAPVIADVLDALTAQGAGLARMSGSGATCFGLFDRADRASAAAATLARNGWWAVACQLASAPNGG
ncbi:4-(cytidine 5'-diphospho)-2-C-methyl-D-erythritol kinase [Paracoccus sp. 1_MG-2023]|uniref:4-(cytidine 5'-diphospho)-2-C-methyl-D-erythritol kinase n=1 Tax=unclassified Paracoccus (in: a-proteobacteria) TaxID=2688777 RepID=UPI001C08626E|nr:MULTISPECIES: 4-(cytidine 5'-diphospho)-2-C-methyl-D-erythritol kinase [unclassified Paracoccus (in: a-proteobacteria)]MBU2956975.1 4-(cytidine 5'-diphospho)-2-C-methyl-D-erythritol kinase [Paracoccus sp. C2R09]MDO6668172.1 4-(cytidine 5'-diphospho)-2-C-methyl-D-erythritol kinase [Paracoccus sp. 1_MG-2023]